MSESPSQDADNILLRRMLNCVSCGMSQCVIQTDNGSELRLTFDKSMVDVMVATLLQESPDSRRVKRLFGQVSARIERIGQLRGNVPEDPGSTKAVKHRLLGMRMNQLSIVQGLLCAHLAELGGTVEK